jgi:uncharacterized RDD family membrane protein YckC
LKDIQILSEIKRAEPLQRIAAVIIDGILINLLSVLLFILPFGDYLIFTFQLLYWLVRDALPFWGGKSMGKKLIGIRVVREGDSSPITDDYGTSLVRNVPLFIPLFQIIDALMVFSEDRKRFGDRWAKTLVIIDKTS